MQGANASVTFDGFALELYNSVGAYIDFKNAPGDDYDVRIQQVGGALNFVSVTGASMTRAGFTMWDSGNDGAASGLDADLLDGQQGAWYADVASRLGFNPLQQGGGSGQSNNKIRIGWDGVGALRVQVDAGDFGSNWPISVTGNAGFLGGQAPSYYTDILARLGYTPVQQGGGAGQSSSKVYIGWGGTKLFLQIDASNFAGTWPIDISGNAASLGGIGPNGYAGVSQATSSNDIAFPIGHTILVNTSGTPSARNAVIAPYTYGSDSNQYVLAAAAAGGSALAGTWRARGTVGSITEAERVA